MREVHSSAPTAGEPEPRREPAVTQDSPTADKVALFRALFRGRDDIYPVRWESKNGRTGYSPACSNEWVPLVCEKPRIKCAECPNRAFLPVTDEAIYDHLAGRQVLGAYPLARDDTAQFVAADFDGHGWHDDVRAYVESCRQLGIPAYVEVSRSGNGAHVWIFFDAPISAAKARQLASAAITRACARHRNLSFTSYDRLFPSQDILPNGGFGNLIALPLQRRPRTRDATVFVDGSWLPYSDQWAFMAEVKRLSRSETESILERAAREDGILGVRPVSVGEDAGDDPWTIPPSGQRLQAVPSGPYPSKVVTVSSNMLYIEKTGLSDHVVNRLARIAAFQNPEFYQAQSLRLSTYGKPRIIGCAEDFENHIALPRGCAEEALGLLRQCGIKVELSDKRFAGKPLSLEFKGTLRAEQRRAVQSVLSEDIGVLCAPTAFGKTVAAAAVIAARRTNTLVIVHRTQLLEQWRNRLSTFLELADSSIGAIGAGRRSPTGIVDIAVMQSLVRKGVVRDEVAEYGQIIVDECHHVSAFSFERVMKQAKARFVLGLTATPVRRDGHHPIVFMQCGPMRYRGSNVVAASGFRHVVVPRRTGFVPSGEIGKIQSVFGMLAESESRTAMIVRDVRLALAEGRRPLVLTERRDHLVQLANALRGEPAAEVIVLAGGLGRRQQSEALDRLRELPNDICPIVVATGRFIGEGFDDPRLDTLFLAMPISWKGTLQQYAGRLHREHVDKSEVRIYDYIDSTVPALARMYEKRTRGYRAMGYEINEAAVAELDL